MKSHVYADHAATTPLCDAAWNAMIPFLREEFGNPSSLHTWAKKPREAVWAARATIARCVGAEPEEIYFTSGGTEADNWEYEEAFISNLHLVGKDGLSYAAALLFSEKAEKWIPGAYVKVGMFGADDSDLLYHDDVHGSLLEQSEKTLDLVYFKYLKAKIWYENGEQRVEKFPFPRGGLRELIYNALVHKDYGSGVPIQISVYADRLYVANVGSLPETWTVETLMSKHVSRPSNPTIAGCIYLTGKIETWGHGVEKVVRECRKHGCPKPRYSVNPGEPGDIMVRVDAAPDAIVESSGNKCETICETISGPISGPIKERILQSLNSNNCWRSNVKHMRRRHASVTACKASAAGCGANFASRMTGPLRPFTQHPLLKQGR